MRWIVLPIAAAVLLAAPLAQAAHSMRAKKRPAPTAPLPDYSAFFCGGLRFTMPPKWLAEVADTPARAGQWKILVPHGSTGEDGEVVALFFGAGKGGGVKESIAAWTRALTTPDGRPVTGETTTRETSGDKISQVVLYGTYSDPVPMAGVPPMAKPNYGLVGTVVENPQGNIYWRFIGPQPLVASNLALFNQMIDSVKPEAK